MLRVPGGRSAFVAVGIRFSWTAGPEHDSPLRRTLHARAGDWRVRAAVHTPARKPAGARRLKPSQPNHERTTCERKHVLLHPPVARPRRLTASSRHRPASVPSCPELATALTAVMRNDARLRDWANLARYRDANRTAAAPARGREVVFMGDSITDAWPQPRFGDFFTGQAVCRAGASAARRRRRC